MAPGWRLVARPDSALHRGGDVAGVLRGAWVLLRLLDFAPPLGLLRQQEVERRLDDLLCRGAGLGVPLTLPRGLELVEELLRHRHVKAAQVGGEGNRGRSMFRRRERRRCSPLKVVGRRAFNSPTPICPTAVPRTFAPAAALAWNPAPLRQLGKCLLIEPIGSHTGRQSRRFAWLPERLSATSPSVRASVAERPISGTAGARSRSPAAGVLRDP